MDVGGFCYSGTATSLSANWGKWALYHVFTEHYSENLYTSIVIVLCYRISH